MNFVNQKNCKTLLSGLVIGCLSLSLASCTLSEPDADKIISGSGPIKSIQQQLVPSYGVEFEYDSKGRIIEIENRITETEIEISYDPLRLEINNGGDEKLIMTNISQNSQGYITGCETTERYFDHWINEFVSNTEYQYFEYDSDGHLLSTRFEGDEEPDHVLTWDGDLLISTRTDDETISYTYTDLDNTKGIWVPFWVSYDGTVEMTGLFGKAPGKLIKSSSSNDEYSDFSSLNFSYSLDVADRISRMTVAIGDTTPLTFNFNYY